RNRLLQTRHSLPTRRSSDLEDERTTTLGAGFGGLGIPASDIAITLSIDQAALDSINAARALNGETSYELFPENSYSIDKLNLSRSEEHTSELQSRENLVCRL